MAIDFDYVDETAGVRLVYQPGVTPKDINSPASYYSWHLDVFMNFTKHGGGFCVVKHPEVIAALKTVAYHVTLVRQAELEGGQYGQ